uniref:Uncharacterized protein n=1 Tax=Heterorhabditis bacteriophora TaxID=37862 RepID=A0A1I7WDC9_HETBA
MPINTAVFGRSSRMCQLESLVSSIAAIKPYVAARLAQSVEHQTLNLAVAGSSPASGFNFCASQSLPPVSNGCRNECVAALVTRIHCFVVVLI